MTEVCAHMSLGPFVHRHVKACSVGEAVRRFRWEVERHYGVLDKSIAEIRGADEMPCVDLYPACSDSGFCCSDRENYHDWPMARYVVGPRGGVRKVAV